MAWQIIAGILAVAAAGTLAYVFREELKEWAQKVIRQILDGINKAIYITSQSIVYLIKEGRRYYKEVRTYLKNRRTGEYELESRRQKIDPEDIPEDLKEEVDYEEEKEILRLRTAA